MIRRLAFLFLFAIPALAQNSPWSSQVLSGAGRPIAGANITVCAAGATGVPCSPTVTIYRDSTNSFPLTQPIQTDSFGNFSFYAPPGNYEYTVSGTLVGPTSAIPFTVPCQPGISCVALNTNNAFTGNNTHSGTETFTGAVTTLNLDDILWVGTNGYSTVAAAVTAAGSVNKTIIAIRSTFVGTCPASNLYSTNPNITIWDFSGLCLPSAPTSFYNGTTYNMSDGNVLALQRHGFTYGSFPGTNLALVANYAITSTNNFTVGGGNTIDGISAECDTFGTFSGTLLGCQAAEHDITVSSTGGTITNATPVLGYFNSAAASTTAVTNVRGVWGKGCNSILGSVPVNCYGGYFNDQTTGGVGKGSGRNYSVVSEGLGLFMYSGGLGHGGFDLEDAAHATHTFLNVDSTSTINVQAINANGFNFLGSGGATIWKAATNLFQLAVNPTCTVAGACDVGTAGLPWGNLWLGTAATNNFKFQPAATAAARTVAIPDPLANVSLGFSYNATNPVYQSKRGVAGCTTAASIGGICASDITVTWGTAFGDANYSVTCTGNTPTNVPAAPFIVSGTKLAGTVHINYFAITAVAASYATIDCIAVHD